VPPTVYSTPTKLRVLSTPSYMYPADAGFWMARNDYVVYYPVGYIPNYISKKVYSDDIYIGV